MIQMEIPERFVASEPSYVRCLTLVVTCSGIYVSDLAFRSVQEERAYFDALRARLRVMANVKRELSEALATLRKTHDGLEAQVTKLEAYISALAPEEPDIGEETREVAREVAPEVTPEVTPEAVQLRLSFSSERAPRRRRKLVWRWKYKFLVSRLGYI